MCNLVITNQASCHEISKKEWFQQNLAAKQSKSIQFVKRLILQNKIPFWVLLDPGIRSRNPKFRSEDSRIGSNGFSGKKGSHFLMGYFAHFLVGVGQEL